MGTEHAGHRARLRERFFRDELDGFAPHEALELLLTFAIPRRDTNLLAHQLITQFGSFHAVLEASPQELCQVPGIGEQAATLIAMIMPLGRMYDQSRITPRPVLTNNQLLFAFCRSLFRGVRVERFYLLCLDARLTLINAALISQGTQTATAASPRLAAAAALKYGAVGVVLCHNHPAGSMEPSPEDIALTDDIVVALTAMEIRVFDHVIVAGDQAFSLRQHHLLPAQSEAPEPVSQRAAGRSTPLTPKDNAKIVR